MSGAVDWVQRSTGLTLNPEQARCVQVLCSFAQPYNLQLIGDGWRSAAVPLWDEHGGDYDSPPLLRPVAFGEKWLIVHLLGSLATFDFPELTRLVLAGHERAVRVEISPQIYRAVNTDAFLWRHDSKTGKDVETDEHPEYPAACLRVAFHARERERRPEGGHIWEWHPTIEQVLVRG